MGMQEKVWVLVKIILSTRMLAWKCSEGKKRFGDATFDSITSFSDTQLKTKLNIFTALDILQTIKHILQYDILSGLIN